MTEQAEDDMKVRVEITMPREEPISKDDFDLLIELLTELQQFTTKDGQTIIFEIHLTNDFKI